MSDINPIVVPVVANAKGLDDVNKHVAKVNSTIASSAKSFASATGKALGAIGKLGAMGLAGAGGLLAAGLTSDSAKLSTSKETQDKWDKFTLVIEKIREFIGGKVIEGITSIVDGFGGAETLWQQIKLWLMKISQGVLEGFGKLLDAIGETIKIFDKSGDDNKFNRAGSRLIGMSMTMQRDINAQQGIVSDITSGKTKAPEIEKTAKEISDARESLMQKQLEWMKKMFEGAKSLLDIEKKRQAIAQDMAGKYQFMSQGEIDNLKRMAEKLKGAGGYDTYQALKNTPEGQDMLANDPNISRIVNQMGWSKQFMRETGMEALNNETARYQVQAEIQNVIEVSFSSDETAQAIAKKITPIISSVKATLKDSVLGSIFSQSGEASSNRAALLGGM